MGVIEIAENLADVKRRLAVVAARAGRAGDDIKIVAVTKTVSRPVIRQAIAAGITDIGENRVQEMVAKHRGLGNLATWHLVGHLQRNKVKKIIGFVDFIHSLDSYELAKEINKAAAAVGKTQKVLVEVNVAEEATKFGVPPDDLQDFLAAVIALKHVSVEGLMTVAPLVDDPQKTRPFFAKLRQLFGFSRQTFKTASWRWLSMGMTNDFEVAVEEGANMIRVGRALFGART